MPFGRTRVPLPLVVCLAALPIVSACSTLSSPTAPDPVPAEFVVPDELAPSLALIDSDPGIVAFLGEPAGAWLRRHVRGVRIEPTLPSNVRARCCEGDLMIQWSTGWFPDPANSKDVRAAAAILLHEARHAQGFLHTCPDQRRDRTYDEGGAWAVQSAWLRHMGDLTTAATIETFDIGCR